MTLRQACIARPTTDERKRVARTRQQLDVQAASYAMGGRHYSRRQVSQELARRFEHLRESEVILAGKQRLLETLEMSLATAMQMLDRTRSRKTQLGQQIETLTGQYRLVKAA